MRYYCIPTTMPEIKNTENTCIGKDVEQWNSHRLLVGIREGTTIWRFLVKKHIFTTLLSNPTPRYYSRKIKRVDTEMCINVSLAALFIIAKN